MAVTTQLHALLFALNFTALLTFTLTLRSRGCRLVIAAAVYWYVVALSCSWRCRKHNCSSVQVQPYNMGSDTDI